MLNPVAGSLSGDADGVHPAIPTMMAEYSKARHRCIADVFGIIRFMVLFFRLIVFDIVLD